MRFRLHNFLRSHRMAAGIICACMTAGAHADRALTWQECAAEAAAHNADLLAVVAQWQSAGFIREGARSGLLPQLSASAGFTYNGGDGLSSAATGGNYSTGLAVTQNVFGGFLDQSKINQATANEAVAATALAIAKARLSFDLKSAFQGLVYAQYLQTLTQDILRRRQDNLRLVELRFDSGRENKGSVLLSRAYLAQAQLDVLQARNAQTVAQMQLARVLGRDNGMDIGIKDALPRAEPENLPDFSTLVVNTPEYLQAIAQEQAAQAGIGLARAPLYPSINVNGQFNFQGNDPIPQDSRWSWGASINYPLFSGGKDTRNIRSAHALNDAATQNRVALQRNLRVKLLQVYNQYVEAVQRQKADQAFYEAAVLRAQIAREKYNNGLLTFDEWDIIENDLVAREKNRLQSERDRVVAQAGWEQSLGRGVIP